MELLQSDKHCVFVSALSSLFSCYNLILQTQFIAIHFPPVNKLQLLLLQNSITTL